MIEFLPGSDVWSNRHSAFKPLTFYHKPGLSQLTHRQFRSFLKPYSECYPNFDWVSQGSDLRRTQTVGNKLYDVVSYKTRTAYIMCVVLVTVNIGYFPLYVRFFFIPTEDIASENASLVNKDTFWHILTKISFIFRILVIVHVSASNIVALKLSALMPVAYSYIWGKIYFKMCRKLVRTYSTVTARTEQCFLDF